jgi:hypothetical protein
MKFTYNRFRVVKTGNEFHRLARPASLASNGDRMDENCTLSALIDN